MLAVFFYDQSKKEKLKRKKGEDADPSSVKNEIPMQGSDASANQTSKAVNMPESPTAAINPSFQSDD